MRLGRVLLGAAALGAIALAFRDFQGGGWLRPSLTPGVPELDEEGEEEVEEEPVLGYDGMDRDSVVDWLREASLDEGTLLRMERYEKTHHNREPVLDAIADQLSAFG